MKRRYDSTANRRKIRKKRIELGLSQEQVALQAGVTTTYLGQVERGERNPTVGFLEKVGESLDVDVIYFFENSSEINGDNYSNQIIRYMQELDEEQKLSIVQLISTIVKTMK